MNEMHFANAVCAAYNGNRAPVTPTHSPEVIEVGTRIESMGHRPVCSCGWVDRLYPLGQLDAARAAAAAHLTA